MQFLFEGDAVLAGTLGRRPTLLGALAVALGVLTVRWLSLPTGFWLAGGILLAVTTLLVWARPHSELALLLLLALSAAFWTESRRDVLLRDPVHGAAKRGLPAWCCGELLEEPRIRADGSRDVVARVRGFSAPGSQLVASSAQVLVRLPRWVRKPLHCGDRVLVWGRLRQPRGPRNPGDFDYRAYLLSRGIVATLYVSSERYLRRFARGTAWSVKSRLVAPVQRFVLRTIFAYLPAREAGLLQGFLLGRKELLDPELRRAFAELGVIHVLAVSGLHVGYVLLVLTGLAAVFRVNWRWRWPLVLLGLAFYVVLTGAKPPVVRASIMAAVFLLAECFQRRYDLFNGLGLAALVVLIWQPQQVGQVGFLLSFAAVASIALLYPRFHELLSRVVPARGLWRQVRDLSAVSLAALLGTLPLTLAYFERFPVFSLPANLIVVPLVGVVVALGIAFVLAAALLPPVVQPLATACWVGLWLVEHLAQAAEELGLGAIHTGHLPVGVTVLVWFALLVSVAFRERWARVAAAVAILAVLNWFVWEPVLFPPPDLEVVFFDVGLGDAALLRTRSGKTLLVDTGERTEHYDAAARVILPYLERERIRHLDGVLISHGHQDHVGGLPTILRRTKVGCVYWNGVPSDAPGWVEGKRVADSLGVQLRTLRAGDSVAALGRCAAVVLCPDSALAAACGPHRQNDASLILLVRPDSTTFLFTGDAEQLEESRLSVYGPLLRTTVLKVAHHGSATSTGQAFLALSKPGVAVISVSRFNRFGFPAKRVLQRLREVGAAIHQTGVEGAVIVDVRRGQVRVKKWR